MTFALSKSVAVITGAASGIGAALARSLAAKSCHLALVDRNAAGLEKSAASARELGVTVSEHVLDLTDAAAIVELPERVLAQHGRVNLLINNAGVSLAGSFAQTDLADFEWLMDINFWGVVRMTHAFLPALQRAPAAQIVNICSIFSIVAPDGQAAYAASKFAVRGFSEALRQEFRKSSIGVTMVHPAGVRTAIATSARQPKDVSEVDLARWRDRTTKVLTIEPDTAAGVIVAGIERRKPRILIGSEARLASLMQRLFPVDNWTMIRRGARLMGR